MTSSLFQTQDQAETSSEPNIRSKMKTTKTSIGRPKDVIKTSFWGHFKGAKTSPKRPYMWYSKRLQDVFAKRPKQDLFRTS